MIIDAPPADKLSHKFPSVHVYLQTYHQFVEYVWSGLLSYKTCTLLD